MNKRTRKTDKWWTKNHPQINGKHVVRMGSVKQFQDLQKIGSIQIQYSI